jgi:hypothetical protein
VRDSTERAELEPSIPHAEEFYQVITTAVRNGHVWSPDERKVIDRLLRDRKRLLKPNDPKETFTFDQNARPTY